MITPEIPFIVNHGEDIISKLMKKSENGFLKAIRSHEGDARRDYVSNSKKEPFVYPSMKSSTKTKGIVLCWCSKPLAHQFLKKVIFSDGGDIQPFYDSGILGTAEHGIYIEVSSGEEGKKIQRFLKSKLVSYIIHATKWSNFQVFPEIFQVIPHPKDLPDSFSDKDIYSYFGLSLDQIKRIEEDQKKSGLASYVPLEAPAVSLPPKAKETNTTPQESTVDYSKMKISDLKQLCKDKKLKGISGKNKEQLIAMLSA
jgi:hypothetical protein